MTAEIDLAQYVREAIEKTFSYDIEVICAALEEIFKNIDPKLCYLVTVKQVEEELDKYG